MEHIKEEKGVSIIDILQKLWDSRKLVIILTLIVSIVLVIPLYFLNKPSRLVHVGFEYNFPGVEDNRYPDGTLFDYRSLVSLGFLENIANSDPKFSEIDIEELYLDENTKISRQEDVLSSERQIIFSENRYHLTIPVKYFKYDEDLAKDFVILMLNQPLNYALDSYDSLHIINNVDYVDNNVEYLESVDYYRTQYNLLVAKYESFIAVNGNVTIDDVTITNHYVSFTDKISKMNTFEELSLLIIQEKYIKNFDNFASMIQLSINVLDDRISLNNVKILDLENVFSNLVAASNLQQAEGLLSNIIQLRLENIDLNKLKNDYSDMLDFIATQTGDSYNTPSLLAKINGYESLLTEYTDKFNDFQTAFYHNQTTLVYDNGSIIIIDGGFGNIVIALISGVFAFSLAVVVVLVKDGFKDSKFNQAVQKITGNGKKEV